MIDISQSLSINHNTFIINNKGSFSHVFQFLLHHQFEFYHQDILVRKGTAI